MGYNINVPHQNQRAYTNKWIIDINEIIVQHLRSMKTIKGLFNILD